MAYAAAAAAILAAATTAYGTYVSGQNQQTMADYNAKVAANDAAAAQHQAEYDAEASAERYKILMGRQRALYAKAGVDLTSGSPLLAMANQAYEAEEEKQAILYGGKVNSSKALNQSTLYSLTGSSAARAGNIGATSSFLSGVANAASSYGMNTKTTK